MEEGRREGGIGLKTLGTPSGVQRTVFMQCESVYACAQVRIIMTV